MKNIKSLNWLNLFLGVWLLITPSVSALAISVVSWNFWILGAAVMISAVSALYDLRPWEEWVNMFVGIWLMLSPWLFGFVSNSRLTWNAVIVSIILIIISFMLAPKAMRKKYQKY